MVVVVVVRGGVRRRREWGGWAMKGCRGEGVKTWVGRGGEGREVVHKRRRKMERGEGRGARAKKGCRGEG